MTRRPLIFVAVFWLVVAAFVALALNAPGALLIAIGIVVALALSAVVYFIGVAVTER